jgi:flagellar hook-associated protein 3 FlgL
MRVATMMPDVQYEIQQSAQTLATAVQQVSTGLRVNQLSDDPAASAAMVRSLATSANVDQYTANATSIVAKIQTADSALSSVITSLNQAITLGTSGANGTNSTTSLQEIATQVQGIMSSIVSQANISYQGTYIFGGSSTQTPPFVASTTSPTQYTYVGNSTVNTVKVGDSMSVQTNLPGDQVFTSGPNVLGSLNALVTALQSGTPAEIGTATAAISTSLNYVSQQRVPLGNTISQIDSQETYLSQEKLTLTTQQTSLVGINLALAATNLSQAELEQGAVLGAAAKVLPQTLLDYLH